MLRAFMFDMDGVIIDSEPIQMMSINEVLSQWGVQLSEEEYIPLVGRRLSDDYAYMKKVYHLPLEYPEFFVQKTEAYGRLIRKNGVEMPGLSELLNRLDRYGVKKSVASGSICEDIELVLNLLKVRDRFDYITGGDEVSIGKPDPEIYLAAARKVGVSPSECVALEDTYYGLAAAKDAGMKCIAFPHRYTMMQDFSRADAVIESLDDITEQLLDSLGK